MTKEKKSARREWSACEITLLKKLFATTDMQQLAERLRRSVPTSVN